MTTLASDARIRLSEARRRVERIAVDRALVVELAEVASFAVRIDPVLLRRLRLRFFPKSAASLEADVWQCELVHVRSPDGFTLTPWVAAALRDRLAKLHRDRYDVAWEVTSASHAALPETLRVEEELNYLERSRRPGSRKRATTILQQAIATVVGTKDRWIAAWGAGAAERASAGIDLGDERRLLSFASTTRLGTATPTLKRGDDWLSWAAGEGVERVAYRVRLGESWLELSRADDLEEDASAEETLDAAQDAQANATVFLPRTSPMVVKLLLARKSGGTSMAKRSRFEHDSKEALESSDLQDDAWRTITLRENRSTIIKIDSSNVVLRTLLGDEYAIGPRPGREGWTIPAPLPNQIGYEPQLDEVARRLRTSDGRPIVVEGPAGAGRRQFSLRAAHAVRAEFARAVLIRLREKPWTERALLSAILRRLGGDRRGSVATAREELLQRSNSARTLLVLDIGGTVAPFASLRMASGSALLVVRRGRGQVSEQNVGPSDVIVLGGLEPQAAVTLFRRWTKRRLPDDVVHAIVQACDLLPVPIIEVAELASTLSDIELGRLPSLIKGAVRLAAIEHPFDRDAGRAVLDEDAVDDNAAETRDS